MTPEQAAVARLLHGHRIEGLEARHFTNAVYRRIWQASEGLDEPSAALIRHNDSSISETQLEALELEIPSGSDEDLKAAIIENYRNIKLTNLFQDYQNNVIDAEQLMELAIHLRQDSQVVRKEWSSLSESVNYALDSIASGSIVGIPIGYQSISNYIAGGFLPGNLITISGYTGHGKTALALNLALKAAEHTKVGIISLEMTKIELAFRAMSILSGVPSDQIKGNRVPQDQLNDLAEAVKSMEDLDLWIDDAPLDTIDYAESVARNNRPGLLIIDHIHLMTAGKDQRVADVSDISRRFKVLAGELNIPILMLAQLRKKGVHESANRQPGIEDLKESSSISQDSNIVMMVSRDEKNHPGEIKVSIEKNRDGNCGPIIMDWEPHLTRITDQRLM